LVSGLMAVGMIPWSTLALDRGRPAPTCLGREFGSSAGIVGGDGATTTGSEEWLSRLFDWTKVAVEPGQSFLDELISGGDVVSVVQLELLVFKRSS
jgi:hypothetical protein